MKKFSDLIIAIYSLKNRPLCQLFQNKSDSFRNIYISSTIIPSPIDKRIFNRAIEFSI